MIVTQLDNIESPVKYFFCISANLWRVWKSWPVTRELDNIPETFFFISIENSYINRQPLKPTLSGYLLFYLKNPVLFKMWLTTKCCERIVFCRCSLQVTLLAYIRVIRRSNRGWDSVCSEYFIVFVSLPDKCLDATPDCAMIVSFQSFPAHSSHIIYLFHDCYCVFIAWLVLLILTYIIVGVIMYFHSV
jgi:hypothetical protein